MPKFEETRAYRRISLYRKQVQDNLQILEETDEPAEYAVSLDIVKKNLEILRPADGVITINGLKPSKFEAGLNEIMPDIIECFLTNYQNRLTTELTSVNDSSKHKAIVDEYIERIKKYDAFSQKTVNKFVSRANRLLKDMQNGITPRERECIAVIYPQKKAVNKVLIATLALEILYCYFLYLFLFLGYDQVTMRDNIVVTARAWHYIWLPLSIVFSTYACFARSRVCMGVSSAFLLVMLATSTSMEILDIIASLIFIVLHIAAFVKDGTQASGYSTV